MLTPVKRIDGELEYINFSNVCRISPVVKATGDPDWMISCVDGYTIQITTAELVFLRMNVDFFADRRPELGKTEEWPQTEEEGNEAVIEKED